MVEGLAESCEKNKNENKNKTPKNPGSTFPSKKWTRNKYHHTHKYTKPPQPVVFKIAYKQPICPQLSGNSAPFENALHYLIHHAFLGIYSMAKRPKHSAKTTKKLWHGTEANKSGIIQSHVPRFFFPPFFLWSETGKTSSKSGIWCAVVWEAFVIVAWPHRKWRSVNNCVGVGVQSGTRKFWEA